MPKRPSVLAGVLLTISIMLTSCASVSPVSDFCLIYEPVYVSDDDTEETVRQVMLNNAAWEEICQ